MAKVDWSQALLPIFETGGPTRRFSEDAVKAYRQGRWNQGERHWFGLQKSPGDPG